MTDSTTNRPIAVVTGATGGMGTQIVADLVRDHHVVVQGRDEEILRSFVQAYGDDNVTVWRADLVADLDALEVPDLDRVDVLVHAAAIAERFSVATATVADWRRSMDLNVHAPAEVTRQLLPALRAAGGTVVFINSGAGRTSYPDNTVYAATKHALYAVADGLRRSELELRVSTVAPGPTDTPMLKGLQDYNPDHVIAPVEVARAVRAVIDAGPTTQLTEVQVRPRIELADR